MTLAEQMAEFVASMDCHQLPVEVIEKGKQCLLDMLGVAVNGSQFEAARIAQSLVTDIGGKKEAVLLGTPYKAPAMAAALANGVSAHVADYDDSLTDFGHPSGVLVSAAMAAGEKVGANGQQLLAALVIGNEVGCKLGQMMGWEHYEVGWHSTGTIGTVAAAAAAASVLALTPPQIVNALGIAASSAAGLRQNFGTMTKSWHVAHAAAAGLTAALLAQRGYDAAADSLEGKAGFVQAFRGKGGSTDVAGVLGHPFSILNVIFKKYPCAHGTHQAVDAVLKLREQYSIVPEEIAAIECYIRPVMHSVLIHHNPGTGLEAKFSMEYCVAAALVIGHLGIPQFADAAVAAPSVRELMGKVRMLTDEKLEEAAREKNLLAPTRVKVQLKDGRILSETVYEARGGPAAPLSWTELEEKFRECTRDILPAVQSEKAITLVRQIEDLDQVHILTACLQGL